MHCLGYISLYLLSVWTFFLGSCFNDEIWSQTPTSHVLHTCTHEPILIYMYVWLSSIKCTTLSFLWKFVFETKINIIFWEILCETLALSGRTIQFKNRCLLLWNNLTLNVLTEKKAVSKVLNTTIHFNSRSDLKKCNVHEELFNILRFFQYLYYISSR